jgi:hypothetical protein
MACNIGSIIYSGSVLQSKLASLSKIDLLRAMYGVQCQISKNLNAGFNCATVAPNPCIDCLSEQQQMLMLAGLVCV